MAADIEPGLTDGLAYAELLPEIRGRIRFFQILSPRIGDPVRLPTGIIQDTHLPVGHITPFAFFAMIIHDPYLPADPLERGEGLPSIFDMNTLLGR